MGCFWEKIPCDTHKLLYIDNVNKFKVENVKMSSKRKMESL